MKFPLTLCWPTLGDIPLFRVIGSSRVKRKYIAIGKFRHWNKKFKVKEDIKDFKIVKQEVMVYVTFVGPVKGIEVFIVTFSFDLLWIESQNGSYQLVRARDINGDKGLIFLKYVKTIPNKNILILSLGAFSLTKWPMEKSIFSRISRYFQFLS